jgi:hypothetical protein
VLNLTHHRSHEFPAALTPGGTFTAKIVLDQIAYRIPAGHRLRVAISNSYWPMIWPSPEAASLLLTKATLTLPVRPLARADEVSFAPPEAATPWQIETLRPAKSERCVEHDHMTGVVTLIVSDDFGEVRDKEHGLVHGSTVRERWSIHPDDPSSARGEIDWTQSYARDGWSVRTETRSAMWSDAKSFHLSARIAAFEGDHLVFERDFGEAVPRDHV